MSDCATIELVALADQVTTVRLPEEWPPGTIVAGMHRVLLRRCGDGHIEERMTPAGRGFVRYTLTWEPHDE